MRKLFPLLLLAHGICSGQVPNLLKDINPGISASLFGSFAIVQSTNVVFGVNTSSSATSGLWTSDGSVTGTIQLRKFTGTVSPFTPYAGKQYFTVAGSVPVLWRTDGTHANTDSIAVSAFTSAAAFTEANGLLFFVAGTAASGLEIWRTDGTAAGTFILKDVWAGAGSGLTVNSIIGSINGQLLFTANDGVTGVELWRTDGTVGGTSLLKDIRSGSGSSGILPFGKTANGIYLLANDGVVGNELWITDGTVAGTHIAVDIAPGPNSGASGMGRLTTNGNYAYFIAQNKLYKTDGTSVNTSTLSAFTPTVAGYTATSMLGMAVNSGSVFVFVSAHYTAGISTSIDSIYLLKSDLLLTNKSVVARKRFSFSNNDSPQGYAAVMQSGSDIVWIFNSSFGSFSHIFITDPVQGVSTLFNGAFDSSQFQESIDSRVFTVGNKMFFPRKSVFPKPGYIDLTNDSLYSLNNSLNYQSSCGPTWIHMMYSLLSKHYFMAAGSDGTGVELYSTNFTSAGTTLVKDIYPGSKDFEGNPNFCPSGRLKGIETPNNIFFAADDGNTGLELWSFITMPPSTVGMSESKNDLTFSLYPNPVSGLLNISASTEIRSICIHNMLGELQGELKVTEGTIKEINMSELAGGLYFVTVAGIHGSKTVRIIKSR
jgi:ELWxxDGT repeat protein